ncbi:MAG: TlpA family protein disulfide reductase [Planctomycetes bacterium]|nr:TlpA family protein disulfide reductase [Planctomycetota bacterium]
MTRSAAALAVLLVLAGCEATPPQGSSSTAEFLKQHQLDGRVVLIEFGLVGCALSEAGLDTMIELDREKEIPELAYVRVEASEDRDAVKEYFAARTPGFPVYEDPGAAVARAFDGTIYPTFVLVDKFGHVRYRGPLPEVAKLIDWAETLVAETADAGPDAPLFGVSAVAVQTLLDETRLPDLKGAVKPLRDYVGRKGLAAVFVDTTCPFSGEAIKDMGKVASTLALHGTPSLLVNLAEPKDKVLEFFAAREMGMPVLYDVTAVTQKGWKVDGVPTVLLLDAEGNVVYRGKAVWADLAVAAEKMLGLAAGSIDFGVKGTEYG